MRGNLAEISLANILKLLESEQQTGILQISTTREQALRLAARNINSDNSIETEPSWSLLLDRGRISYAFTNWNSNLSRLQDYLSYDRLEGLVTISHPVSVNTSKDREYDYLHNLLREKSLSSIRAKTIISNIIEENLWEVLSLNRGEFIFKPGYYFANSIVEKKITPSVEKVSAQLRLWQQFYPYIVSPQQQIILLDRDGLAKIASAKTHTNLTTWSTSRLSLIQLSRKINCQLIDLAAALYPYLKKGLIKLQDLDRSNSGKLSRLRCLKNAHIVCIHDNVAVRKKVEYILNHRGYQSTVFVNPIQALTEIFTIQPDLILCKDDFPKLSGYELCSMLQTSQTCRQTKFVILQEEDSLSNRLQSKISGGEDYVTLPFTQNELLITIDKHLDFQRTQNSITNKSQVGAKRHV